MLQNYYQYAAYQSNKVTEYLLNYAHQSLIDKNAPNKIQHHALLTQTVPFIQGQQKDL